MKCLNCNFNNIDSVKFCEECGDKMDVECPNCGNKVLVGRKFCGECGYNLTEPSEIPINYSSPRTYTP